jgi:hypothetical protein
VTLNERFTCWAQVVLSIVYIGGYFAVLFTTQLGYIRVPTDFKDSFNTLLGALTAGVLLILQFWFSRQRPPSVT